MTIKIFFKGCFHIVESGNLALGLDSYTIWFCGVCVLTKHHTHSRAWQVLYDILFLHINTLYQKVSPPRGDTLSWPSLYLSTPDSTHMVGI